LRGLGVEDVAAMTAAAAGHDLDADGLALAGEIAAETDGNPFFVSEILRNLSESGLVVFDEEQRRWRIDRGSGVALPESVREVVERRVGVLGERAWEVLTSAAVIGRTFDLELLARIVDVGENELLSELEQAVETTTRVDFCRRCGVQARLHDRRPTYVRARVGSRMSGSWFSPITSVFFCASAVATAMSALSTIATTQPSRILIVRALRIPAIVSGEIRAPWRRPDGQATAAE